MFTNKAFMKKTKKLILPKFILGLIQLPNDFLVELCTVWQPHTMMLLFIKIKQKYNSTLFFLIHWAKIRKGNETISSYLLYAYLNTQHSQHWTEPNLLLLQRNEDFS